MEYGDHGWLLVIAKRNGEEISIFFHEYDDALTAAETLRYSRDVVRTPIREWTRGENKLS
jgi:hypothetical protein